MLIETNPLDLSKPLVYYDGNGVNRAILVSDKFQHAAYGTSLFKYGVVVYSEEGDSIKAFNSAGIEAGTTHRRLFNTCAKTNLAKVLPLSKEITKSIKDLGEF